MGVGLRFIFGLGTGVGAAAVRCGVKGLVVAGAVDAAGVLRGSETAKAEQAGVFRV